MYIYIYYIEYRFEKKIRLHSTLTYWNPLLENQEDVYNWYTNM